jgi:hypothetical protein
VVNGHKNADQEEQCQEWFLNYLKYQAQSNAFFEYLIMEDENGRK